MSDNEQDKKFSLKDKIKAALENSPEAQMLQSKFEKLSLPSLGQQRLAKTPVLSDFQRTSKPKEAPQSPRTEKKTTQPIRHKRKKPR